MFCQLLPKIYQELQSPLSPPHVPFVVEVDASTTCVGALLLQHHVEPPCLHPCAYFSRKLTPAEQSYDIGNRDLLTINLSLEEWRHWLEGAQPSLEVITDHKNLEYIRSAKRLNPRQACWSLFFTWFLFTITYRPGDKNIKADSLSHIHSPDEAPASAPILPPALIVSSIQWDQEDQICVATLSEPAPPGGPEGKTSIPSSLRTTLLSLLHASLGSGHPGSQRTFSLLQARYWFAAAQSVPSPRLHITSLLANSCPFLSHAVPGPTSESTL